MGNENIKSVKTTCCYCGVGCGIEASLDKQGRLSVAGNKTYPVNRGALCSKGMNLHYTVMDQSDRLLYPEMRYARNEPRKRVSWDVALERTATVFKTLIEKFGPDSVAIYASGQCLTEEYYVINKLMKGFIRTNNIDTNSRLCMSSAVVAYKMSLGEDIVPVNYDDLGLADCIFVAGANPAWCHPILWRKVEAAKANNPALKLIVSDPRRTQSAEIADLHLQIHPGTDIVLHNAIGRCLIEEGFTDPGFIKNHTDGFSAYRDAVMKMTVEEAAVICGVGVPEIKTAAAYIGNATAYLSMWTMGLNQSVVGVQKNLSLINLHLVTGQIGKPGAGPLSLTGQPNAMGGREVGGMSNLLPAHRELSNPDHRATVEQFWKIPVGSLSSTPGYTATEMFAALETGTLKAIWIIGTNPLVSLPDARMAEAALKKARYIVVQDISSKAETLAYADLVLPAAAWLEKEGTMTNAERRISHLSKLVEAPGEALPDATIICRFAEKMGFHGFDFRSTAAIFSEHAALTAGTNMDLSGVDYDVLKQAGSVQWPYSRAARQKDLQRDDVNGSTDKHLQLHDAHIDLAKGLQRHDAHSDLANGLQRDGAHGDRQEDTVPGSFEPERFRLFSDHIFYTKNGRAIFHPVLDDQRAHATDINFPLVLTTGRIRDQWHTMSKTGKVNKLRLHTPEPVLEIHAADAAARGINNGDLVQVLSSQGDVRVRARWSDQIKKGVVFLPMHWGLVLSSDLNRANNLTANRVDPLSKEPDFKFTAVEVKKYQKLPGKIIIIGAGAGACGFVKSYRSLQQQDDLQIFSNEDLPFYNRVLLPDYINGSLQWQSLVKMTDQEEPAYRIRLHRGVAITKIDRSNKSVTDSNGEVHPYDTLILATGSRAARPKDIPDMTGIFTMRSRKDADGFTQHTAIHPGTVVILGGGLLGIELAASLRETDHHVVIIQRISRLMDRQLDPLASQMLHDELTDKGVEIFYNDEISAVFGGQHLTGIQLRSGRVMACCSLVIAVGTIPNIEIAREAGIQCKRGVVVNEYLQTNDPDIYAIGEIAEFNGFLYGITAAAEEQAAVAAAHLSGHISGYYQGSLLMNILKMHDFDLCSLGMAEAPDGQGYEEVVFIDKARRYYKKCIIYNDRLVGAILIGDKSEFLEFRDLISKKTELSDKRLKLLRSGSKAEPVLGRLVCSCGGVGEGNIRAKVQAGCSDLVQLCQLTGAGSGCGSCRPEIGHILNSMLHLSSESSTQLAPLLITA